MLGERAHLVVVGIILVALGGHQEYKLAVFPTKRTRDIRDIEQDDTGHPNDSPSLRRYNVLGGVVLTALAAANVETIFDDRNAAVVLEEAHLVAILHHHAAEGPLLVGGVLERMTHKVVAILGAHFGGGKYLRKKVGSNLVRRAK